MSLKEEYFGYLSRNVGKSLNLTYNAIYHRSPPGLRWLEDLICDERLRL